MDLSRVAEKKVVLQFVDNILLNTQGIYYHIVAAVKFDEIKAAESRSILVLIAAVDLQIQPLYLIRQICHGIGIHHYALPSGHSRQHGNHHRRGGSEAGAWRRVALQIDLAALADLHCF